MRASLLGYFARYNETQAIPLIEVAARAGRRRKVDRGPAGSLGKRVGQAQRGVGRRRQRYEYDPEYGGGEPDRVFGAGEGMEITGGEAKTA